MRSTAIRTMLFVSVAVVACLAGFEVAYAESVTWYVDDDAPNDPGPGDPATSDPAEDGSADHPYDAIQEALDAASAGDTIIVGDGTYTGAGNRDIDFGGKAVHLRSENGPENCIIDCQGTESEPHRGFYFGNGEDENSIVDGFTIKNGYASNYGGGICCENYSSPTITNNTITGNTANSRGAKQHLFCKLPGA